MARIGLNYCVYSPLTEDEEAGTFTYGAGKRGRKLIQADIKLNISDSKLYADDNIAESLREFIDGTLTIGQDDLTDVMKTDWLGNTATSVTVGSDTVSGLSSKDTDIAPYHGLGYIQPKVVDSVRQYRAIWFTKIQFGEPDESGSTKGQSISWQTPSVVGTIMRRLDGIWKEETTVPTLATAIAWLKDKAGIPAA